MTSTVIFIKYFKFLQQLLFFKSIINKRDVK